MTKPFRALIDEETEKRASAYAEVDFDTFEKLMNLLQEWVDINDEPCRLDHHGYCQTHFLEEDCIFKRSNEALAAYEKGEK